MPASLRLPLGDVLLMAAQLGSTLEYRCRRLLAMQPCGTQTCPAGLRPDLQVLTYGIATAAILRLVLIVAGVDIGEAGWGGGNFLVMPSFGCQQTECHTERVCCCTSVPCALQWSDSSRCCCCLPPSCLSPASSC